MRKFIPVSEVILDLSFDLPENAFNELLIRQFAERVILSLPVYRKTVPKSIEVKIDEHKGVLPNYQSIISIFYKTDKDLTYRRMKKSTGAAMFESLTEEKYYTDHEYTIENCSITTSFSKGIIIVNYKTNPADCDGNLLMEDIEPLKQAIYYYVIYRYYNNLVLNGDKEDYRMYANERNTALEMYQMYKTKAVGEINRPEEDDYENLSRLHNRLLTRKVSWDKDFSNLNNHEEIDNV